MPKVEILIVSYAKDLPYLRWCLESIKKFATDFSGVTLVVPSVEIGDFKDFAQETNWKLRVYNRTEDKRKWHLAAQVEKCLADQHCPDADFILHTDSDCIFTEPVTPDDYFVNGKPVMVIEAYSRLKGNPWQSIVRKALGWLPEYETMRRHPQVNPVGIYADVRQRVERVNRMRFADWVLMQKGDFPFGFTEHNTIGAVALRDLRWRTAYHWIDAGKETPPKEKLLQFWSHSPPDKPQKSQHGETDRAPMYVIKGILGE